MRLMRHVRRRSCSCWLVAVVTFSALLLLMLLHASIQLQLTAARN